MRGVSCVAAAIAASGASLCAGCFHDFSVFEPVGSADAGPGPTSAGDAAGADVGAVAEASTPGDASPPPVPEASVGGDGSSCGSDCRIEALSCAGTCAQIEQSCAAACTDGGSTCTQACLASESTCTSQCVTQCETCTSGEGCLDPTGCSQAAP